MLLSLKKDSQGGQMTRDEDAMTQAGTGGGGGGAKCHTNWDQKTKDGTEMTGLNDQRSKMALVSFGKSLYCLNSA